MDGTGTTTRLNMILKRCRVDVIVTTEGIRPGTLNVSELDESNL